MYAAWILLLAAALAWAAADEPRYVVEVLGGPGAGTGDGIHAIPCQGRDLSLLDHEGERFECCLPPGGPNGEPERQATAAHVSAADLFAGGPLVGRCAYLIDDWWTYEFCHDVHVRQYHKEGKVVTASFVLGLHNSSMPTVVLKGMSFDGERESTYASQLYANGSPCDVVTGANRSVEVRFTCNAGTPGAITSLHEAASCRYVLEVATSGLCSHPAFLPMPAAVERIPCRPAVRAHSL